MSLRNCSKMRNVKSPQKSARIEILAISVKRKREAILLTLLLVGSSPLLIEPLAVGKFPQHQPDRRKINRAIVKGNAAGSFAPMAFVGGISLSLEGISGSIRAAAFGGCMLPCLAIIYY